MKWFFAINQACTAFPDYADLIKVAVLTARRHTSLKPYCLYDGEDCVLTEWLHAHAVEIIPCRSRFYPRLSELARERGESDVLNIGAGAFLRLEIPKIARQQGFDDDFVLYTDCDVMFLREVVPALAEMSPRFFSVAPETQPKNYVDINTGVMLINLKRMIMDDAAFTAFTERYLDLFTTFGYVYDQSAYYFFYRPFSRWLFQHGVSPLWTGRLGYRLRWFNRPFWGHLPLAFNWKPYWGRSETAAIIHFHGPKPYLTPEQLQNSPQILQSLAKGEYLALSEQWRTVLQEASTG